MSSFTKDTISTLAVRLISLLLGIVQSVIVARLLGPSDRGLYTLTLLFPSLLVSFFNLGIPITTTYHLARNRYPRQLVFGNTTILNLVIAVFSLSTGVIVVSFFGQVIFPNVPKTYLFLSLFLIPLLLIFRTMNYLFLGVQQIGRFNFSSLLQIVLELFFTVVALWALDMRIYGAISASFAALLVTSVIVFFQLYNEFGGIQIKVDRTYLQGTFSYGIKAYFSSTLTFLNYRLDMLMLNAFMTPIQVGYYAIAVSIAEKLSMTSQAAGTVLFPRIAAQSNAARNVLTPAVSRHIFWVTACGMGALFFMSAWLVRVLYSSAYAPAVEPLKILLPGIVCLSVTRLLENDIGGRGRPGINLITGSPIVLVGAIMNLLWIPRFGIIGAAWASTVSYVLQLALVSLVYFSISKSSFWKTFFIQLSDLKAYGKIFKALLNTIKIKRIVRPHLEVNRRGR
jgi:O-antigen/teichoic acid export membrane protein